MNALANGFICETCGTFHKFTLYVCAHSDVELIRVCHVCLATHNVLNFEAELIEEGRMPAKDGQA